MQDLKRINEQEIKLLENHIAAVHAKRYEDAFGVIHLTKFLERLLFSYKEKLKEIE